MQSSSLPTLNLSRRTFWLLSALLLAMFFIVFLFYTRNDVSLKFQSSDIVVNRTTLCDTMEGAPITLPCGMSINTLGRLGNLMGEYATLLALAKLNNRKPVLQPDMYQTLESYFHISLRPMSSAELDFWKTRWSEVNLHNWMEPRLESLTSPFTLLTGYPCSWTFYHHLRTHILQEFRFRDYILEKTQQTLHSLKNGSTSVTFIGVHVRRTDYVREMAGRWRGVMADTNFFRHAFDIFEAKYPDALFLVVSDDMDWCKKNIENPNGNVIFVGNGNSKTPIYDLALLAHCNHSVITMGTFGFWSAYLAGGETVYYSNYTLPDSTFYNLKYDKWYLPEWIPIAANLSNFVEHPT